MLKKTIAAAAIGLAFSGSASALTFLPFTVDRNSTGNTAGPGTFVADKITGNYTEVITFNADNTFDVSILWEAGQFVTNSGNTPIVGFVTGLGNTYGLYGLMTGSGTFNTAGVTTTFNVTSGSVEFWQDNYAGMATTSFAAPGVGGAAFTLGDDADDILLAGGTVINPSSGQLSVGPTCIGGINCGSFGQTTEISLTTEGEDFFTGPSPFHNFAFMSGQLNSFAVSGTQTINGSLDLVFITNQVPEPASLALLGLGLLGLGAMRRRN